MKLSRGLIIIIIVFIFQSCNSLYKTKTINIEIFEPAKVTIPEMYGKIAIRYNNSNVSFNPFFAEVTEENINSTELKNIDSIASKNYFKVFSENLKSQQFFDTIFEIQAKDYSDILLIDTLIKTHNPANDSLWLKGEIPSETYVSIFASLYKKYPVEKRNYKLTQIIDPEFGLYTREDLQQIADSTGADMLISFDYYANIDSKVFLKKYDMGVETIYSMAFWNFYDLKEVKIKYYYDRIDTVSWKNPGMTQREAFSKLPPRKDAVLNASDIAAVNFIEFLIPHWIEVQRMYYHSGQVDLKKTDKLIEGGNWIEAAKIWKQHVNNPNKSIAAKCMFNMGLACEMEGDLDAAIDWVVKSFQVFGQKNEINYFNCMEYIRILGQRKLDIKKIDTQLTQ